MNIEVRNHFRALNDDAAAAIGAVARAARRAGLDVHVQRSGGVYVVDTYGSIEAQREFEIAVRLPYDGIEPASSWGNARMSALPPRAVGPLLVVVVAAAVGALAWLSTGAAPARASLDVEQLEEAALYANIKLEYVTPTAEELADAENATPIVVTPRPR